MFAFTIVYVQNVIAAHTRQSDAALVAKTAITEMRS